MYIFFRASCIYLSFKFKFKFNSQQETSKVVQRPSMLKQPKTFSANMSFIEVSNVHHLLFVQLHVWKLIHHKDQEREHSTRGGVSSDKTKGRGSGSGEAHEGDKKRRLVDKEEGTPHNKTIERKRKFKCQSQ